MDLPTSDRTTGMNCDMDTHERCMDNVEDESRAVEMQSRVFKQGSSDSNGASVANIGLQFHPLKDDELGQ